MRELLQVYCESLVELCNRAGEDDRAGRRVFLYDREAILRGKGPHGGEIRGIGTVPLSGRPLSSVATFENWITGGTETEAGLLLPDVWAASDNVNDRNATTKPMRSFIGILMVRQVSTKANSVAEEDTLHALLVYSEKE